MLTAGKLGIFDALCAETGKYLFSFDVGLQTLVSRIDPETGKKIVDPARIPRNGQAQFYCLSTAGADLQPNFETRKTVWTARLHAPETSGVLATAGGLVFAGSLDRLLRAYDDATGTLLWETRLNDALSSMTHARLVPDIVAPTERSSTLWVFELPEDVADRR